MAREQPHASARRACLALISTQRRSRVARASGALRLLGLARADAALPALETTVRLQDFILPPERVRARGQVGLFAGGATVV